MRSAPTDADVVRAMIATAVALRTAAEQEQTPPPSPRAGWPRRWMPWPPAPPPPAWPWPRR
ncbi:hypothetical protein ACFQU7_19250 [Pseudoroseomonas wenyumeiae]